jgi:hypothetical protein
MYYQRRSQNIDSWPVFDFFERSQDEKVEFEKAEKVRTERRSKSVGNWINNTENKAKCIKTTMKNTREISGYKRLKNKTRIFSLNSTNLETVHTRALIRLWVT